MRRWTRALTAAVVALTVSTVALTACTPASATAKNSMSVHAGQDAHLTTSGDALLVNVPGSAIEGSGRMSVSPVSDPARGNGWRIAMSGGAKLVGSATLRFKHDFAKGEPAPVVVSTEDGSTFTPAEDVRVSGRYAEVTTTHFSNWFTTWWGDVLNGARGLLDTLYKGAGKQPTCAHEDDVRKQGYAIKSDGGSLVFWCLGLDANGAPQLRVTNGRGYTVLSESMPGFSATSGGPTDLAGMVANAIKDRVSTPGDTVNLVGPGDTIDYSVTGTGTMLVGVKPSAAGYLVSAGQFAVDTLAMILDKFGHGGMSREAIAKLFDWGSCISGFSSMATADVQTSAQAFNYLNDATGTILGCMSGAIERAGLGLAGAAIATGVSWLISGVRTALNGFGAAADSALNPFGYTITLSAPAPTLPGLPAELSGRWCPRSGQDVCFDSAELLSRWPNAFVSDTSKDYPVPGATEYGICAEADMGPNECSMAASMFIAYYPPGVSWNCVQVEVIGQGWPSCDPDFTSSHDVSQPRVTILYNHQMDPQFRDSEALYRAH
ncbi:hypothetical protein [Leifsonia sp. fls2-241-R2A-40a]|uniref:hypothetical protein n=1 Tax=Leifsonia sp. fls2-241-R2A-40a TaxID=3040290 RepID=UPI00254FD23F|nr:hypothetical protein [Leifsonia sp. fls2-241-R2A-40a]